MNSAGWRLSNDTSTSRSAQAMFTLGSSDPAAPFTDNLQSRRLVGDILGDRELWIATDAPG